MIKLILDRPIRGTRRQGDSEVEDFRLESIDFETRGLDDPEESGGMISECRRSMTTEDGQKPPFELLKTLKIEDGIRKAIRPLFSHYPE